MPHSTYFAERMGCATIAPAGDFEAGSFQSFTLVYAAGYFGIDATKVSGRDTMPGSQHVLSVQPRCSNARMGCCNRLYASM